MLLLSLFLALATSDDAQPRGGAPPRGIVLIYTDDLGYGDVGCYEGSALKTPHIDQLATQGLRFTDAHCSAATCTPSRFALLTGSYAFRQKGTGILRGNANLIIPPGTTTLPGLLRRAGYQTGIVGKWHLGLGDGALDWNGDVRPGPNEVGFDYHFLVPATGDRTPCVYLEQGRVVGLDPEDPIQVSYGKRIGDAESGKERPDLLKQMWSHGHNSTIVNGISRIGWMTGGESARWVDEDMADVLVERAAAFLDRNADKPFFLMFSTHDIHVPRVPHPRFIGKSGMGPRGDAILQTDMCVGALTEKLIELGLADDTLVIFTSDNGPVLDDGYADQANEELGEHDPNGPWRGGKYSRFEGGTRVPFIARWPGEIPAGSKSSALLGQIDLAATLAGIAGAALEAGACPDSLDARDALLGEDPIGRAHLIHEAGSLALRVGQWKYVPPGKTREGLGPWTQVKTPTSGALYDLSKDPGETTDLSESEAARREEMIALLARIRKTPDRGRQR